jgi:hypothetical protein
MGRLAGTRAQVGDVIAIDIVRTENAWIDFVDETLVRFANGARQSRCQIEGWLSFGIESAAMSGCSIT